MASAHSRRPPIALLLYLAILAVLVLIDLFVPYEVETTYEPLAAVVYLGLLAGVAGGSAICRRILVALGLYDVTAVRSTGTSRDCLGRDLAGQHLLVAQPVGPAAHQSPPLTHADGTQA
jgi:hypothetical protein